MANTDFDVERALEDVSFPAGRQTLVKFARAHRLGDDVVNTVHLLPDREYDSTGEIAQAVRQLAQNERTVWRVLDAPLPPIAPLGADSDYEQLVVAWANRNSIGMDRLLELLEQSGAPLAMQLASEIRSDADKRAIFDQALSNAFSADWSTEPPSAAPMTGSQRPDGAPAPEVR